MSSTARPTHLRHSHCISGARNKPEALATERVQSKSSSMEVIASVRFREDRELSDRNSNRLFLHKPFRRYRFRLVLPVLAYGRIVIDVPNRRDLPLFLKDGKVGLIRKRDSCETPVCERGSTWPVSDDFPQEPGFDESSCAGPSVSCRAKMGSGSRLCVCLTPFAPGHFPACFAVLVISGPFDERKLNCPSDHVPVAAGGPTGFSRASGEEDHELVRLELEGFGGDHEVA